MTASSPAFPLDPDRLGRHLVACGFISHQLNDYPGLIRRGPAIVHIAHPGHTVVAIELTDPDSTTGRVYTELAVFPAEARHLALTGGPVERAHARVFDAMFGSNTPPALIHAAAVAALTANLHPTTEREEVL